MLKTAEALLGPYVWGTYDLLILPPSFPYGGMENPCLTFVTPTLLVSFLKGRSFHTLYDGKSQVLLSYLLLIKRVSISMLQLTSVPADVNAM